MRKWRRSDLVVERGKGVCDSDDDSREGGILPHTPYSLFTH